MTLSFSDLNIVCYLYKILTVRTPNKLSHLFVYLSSSTINKRLTEISNL